MALTVSKLTGGTNSHQETSETANAFATDFVNSGVVGAITNTSGVAPATGAFAVNAQGSPNMTVAVSSGVAYVVATPDSQGSQSLRVKNSASSNVTISANSSGSTKYDWVYIKINPTLAANPAVAADNVATLVTSRSSNSATDDGTPPTYGYNIAIVTVANSASSITNGNITDKRAQLFVATGTDGWTASPYAWTYASATTFTIAGVDATAYFPTGTKLRLIQTTTKYFRVISSSFSTDTTVTVTGVGDYTLANAAITSPYYSYQNTPQGFPRKQDGTWWEELGRTTLSSTADSISVSISARKYLLIRYSLAASGSINALLQLNSDTGSTYSYRSSINGAGDGTAVSQTSGQLVDTASQDALGEAKVVLNSTSKEKVIVNHGVRFVTGAANAPSRLETVIKWANTAAQITSVQIINSSTGDYASGSEVIVLGHD